ncbi:helix-turn-helix transcriptional regulator [Amycolatopsis sp. NPDC051106]|uniref:helix-turn-helix domain-containing protein n=1 Tax=unclassified Amycolatopsis TaxID=2618356 RepID=UPI003423D595
MATPFATPRARALGFGLRACRTDRDLGVRELARLIGVLPQELSNWEYGKRIPKVEQVALLLGVLVVEPGERARLLELAGNAREPSWLEKAVPPFVSAYVEYERAATEIFNWEPLLVPGLLQTDEYARALLGGGGLKANDIENLVLVRRMRRGVLAGLRPASCQVVIDERALRPGIAEGEVMAGQLRHLLAVSRRKNLRLQILPSGDLVHPGLHGNFAIFEFEALPPIVAIEEFRAVAYLYDEDQVASYREAAEGLAASALDEQGSSALIEAMVADLEVRSGSGGVAGFQP